MRTVVPVVVSLLIAGSALSAETLPHRAVALKAKTLAPAATAVASSVATTAPQMQEMEAPEPDILVMRINANGEKEVACVHGEAAHRAFIEQGPKNRIANDATNGNN